MTDLLRVGFMSVFTRMPALLGGEENLGEVCMAIAFRRLG